MHTTNVNNGSGRQQLRSNPKVDSEGQCPAGEPTLLLLGLGLTHGKDLLQNFLDIFIHLALEGRTEDSHWNLG